jgi:5-methylcytosine-specific restriction endonuclease McrA
MLIDMQLEFPDLDCATIDHVVPVSRNGEHSLGNTQLAHFRCNIWKSDRLPDALAAD